MYYEYNGYNDYNGQNDNYNSTGNTSPDKDPKEKKKGTFGKFLGKAVSAGLVFGLCASLMFTGANSLLGNITSSSSSSGSGSSSGTSTAIPTVTTSSSGDASEEEVTSSTDVSDMVAEVMPSIVAINVVVQETNMFGQTEDYEGAGSGIIVAQTDDTLYIVTNNHVVEDTTSVEVVFIDDTSVSAEIKGTDSTSDLAVLSVNKSDLSEDTLGQISIAVLGDSDSVEVGESCYVVGNALGYGQSVTAGIISAVNREISTDEGTNTVIQTDAAINGGNSGGALLNADGEVIGISEAKYVSTEVEGMCYAIPISTAIPIINELIEREAVSEEDQAYLGVAGMDVSSDVAAMYNMPEGIYVSQVFSGSSAESAGIQVGDIITSFDGTTMTSMEQLQELMQYYAAGTTVEVVLQRADISGSYEEVTLSVTLGSKN